MGKYGPPTGHILQALAWGLLLAGCSGLLPNGEQLTRSQWQLREGPRDTFERFRDAFDRVEIYRTSEGELRALGLHPAAAPNVTALDYLEVMDRLGFDPRDESSQQSFHPGVRYCMQARVHCQGYLLDNHHIQRDRTGSFWLDFFGFKRETRETGWSFEALLLVKNGMVVFKSWDGQPHIENVEVARDPLGPFQNLIALIQDKVFTWGGL